MNEAELIREFWRTWNEEGLEGLHARYDEFFTEDLEWRPPIAGVTGGCYVGREGFAKYVTDVRETLTDLTGEFEEATEIGPGIFRSKIGISAEGSSSGAAFSAHVFGITRFRDGRISRAWASYEPAHAERVEAAILRGEEPDA